MKIMISEFLTSLFLDTSFVNWYPSLRDNRFGMVKQTAGLMTGALYKFVKLRVEREKI